MKSITEIKSCFTIIYFQVHGSIQQIAKDNTDLSGQLFVPTGICEKIHVYTTGKVKPGFNDNVNDITQQLKD